MKFIQRLTICIFLVSLFASTLNAQETQQSSKVVDVDVTLFMIDVDEIDSVKQIFTGTVYAEFKWHDPNLAHNGSDSISKKLSDIWYPHTQILNQQRLVDTFPSTAEIRPNGDVIFKQRVWGNFSQALELEHFPFDKQKLNLTLVNVGFGSKQVRYQVHPDSGVAESLKIPDWNVTSWEVTTSMLAIGSGTSSVSAVVLSMDVERYTSYFLLKIILPLMLIVAMSWVVFWIDPSMAASQISVGVTAMLTLIAYRFAIGGMVPRLGFLTSLDYFVMGSTILVFLCLLEVVYTTRLFQSGQKAKARAVDHYARWIVPSLYVFIVVETLYLRLGM